MIAATYNHHAQRFKEMQQQENMRKKNAPKGKKKSEDREVKRLKMAAEAMAQA